MMIEGFNPGGLKTQSNIFVAPDGYMYFQGTDHAVWRVNIADASDRTNFGGPNTIKTQSNICVGPDGYMYFQGTDQAVWRMSPTNPSDRTNFGGPNTIKTQSDIFVAHDGYMYFQGTDHAVWRMSPTNPSDRTNFGGPNVIKTQSDIFVAHDGYMYFQGTDHAVWRMSPTNPSDRTNFGGPNIIKTQSNICVGPDGYMYFQGTDQAVWRMSPTNPSDRTNFGGPNVIKTQSDVLVATDGYMYFRGTDDKVWRVNVANASDRTNPGGFTTTSNVLCAGGCMYFQGTDQKVWQFYFVDGPLQAYAHAAAETLQGWYNWNEDLLGKNAGLWQGTGWWNSANALNALIDYMTITKTRSYVDVVVNTFNNCKSNNFLNGYYDDEGWWALTWINAYDLTQDTRYLDMAKTIFQDITGGWGEPCGGGVWWDKSHTYKNAIANELFLTIAVRLYLRTTTQAYLDWATREWAWFQQSKMINPQHLVNDGLTVLAASNTCTNNGKQGWTYNQGVILGGLVDLSLAMHDGAYLAVAREIANAAIAALGNAQGILTEPGSGGPDLPQFKGIFMRNLAYLYSFDGQPNHLTFIQKNAQSLLQYDRTLSNQFGYAWAGPFDTADAARQTSALDALNAAMRVSSPEEDGSMVVARTPQHMDVFWVHPDGSINSTWWDANAAGGAWDPARVFAATAPGKAAGGWVSVVARTPDHMDLFWVHPDGSINSTWWDANVAGGAWDPTRVFAATAPGQAAGGWVSVVARTPDHMDLFWVHPDGSINSTWWDANVAGGAWDPARVFAATAPGAGGRRGSERGRPHARSHGCVLGAPGRLDQFDVVGRERGGRRVGPGPRLRRDGAGPGARGAAWAGRARVDAHGRVLGAPGRLDQLDVVGRERGGRRMGPRPRLRRDRAGRSGRRGSERGRPHARSHGRVLGAPGRFDQFDVVGRERGGRRVGPRPRLRRDGAGPGARGAAWAGRARVDAHGRVLGAPGRLDQLDVVGRERGGRRVGSYPRLRRHESGRGSSVSWCGRRDFSITRSTCNTHARASHGHARAALKSAFLTAQGPWTTLTLARAVCIDGATGRAATFSPRMPHPAQE